MLEDIWAPAFVALVLSFVTGGRLRSRLDRLIVAGVFVAVFVLDLFSMLFVEQPGNVLLAFPSEDLYGAVDGTQRTLEILLSLSACAVIAARWLSSSPPRRRALLAELQASRQRLVAAGDAERQRLERDLHDGAQQRLVALSLQLRMLRSDIRRDPAHAEQLAVAASAELANSLAELRDLARGIHPAGLDHGLASALESLAARSVVHTAVSCDAPERVPRAVELAMYFVTCEALANVGKYARATAASVRVSRTATGLSVEIADDGMVARTPPEAPACTAWPTASRRSTGICA